MPQAPRKRSESEIYHVFSRGVGGHILFEDDEDKQRFLTLLQAAAKEYGAELYAYCLMGNHFHVLIKKELEQLSQLIGVFQGRYAKYFNARHERFGHLFQGRFGSKPVVSDEQLMTVVRYIHLNPAEDGLSDSCEYPWSSYAEYLGMPKLVSTDFVLGVFGGVERFASFHEHGLLAIKDGAGIGDGGSIEDIEAVKQIKQALGEDVLARASVADREERDSLLRDMKRLGYGNSRIARITGLGISIVRRA